MLAPGGAAYAVGPPVPADAVVLTSENASSFQGWGTSLAWWANVVGGWSSMRAIDEDLFGLPDGRHPDRLGLNVLRYDIGASPVVWCAGATGGDCAPAPAPGRNLPVAAATALPPGCRSFGPGKAVPALLDPLAGPTARIDLRRDRNQVAVLRDALSRQRRGSFVLEAFANSPPWWLTANGCPQGSTVPFGDNLSADRFGDYADYLARVLRAFREAGIAFATVDPLNEPENPWGLSGLLCPTGDCQEGASLSTQAQGPLLQEVCRRLGAGPRATRLSVPDGFNPTDTVAMFAAAGYGALPAGCFAQVNTHMYDFVPPSSLVPYGQGFSLYGQGGGQRGTLSDLARTSSKRLWMSEFGTGGAAGDMGSALTYSATIASDLKYLRPAAWLNWQAVEASGHWGLFEASTWPAEGPVVKTRRFYALEQYSRFIRPGSWLLSAADPLDDPAHETTPTIAAADDPRHPGRVVIVGTNLGAARSVTYDLGRLGIHGAATVARFRTAADEQVHPLGSVALRARTFTDEQPPGSITTYVIDLRRER
jgi:hypothetical protein